MATDSPRLTVPMATRRSSARADTIVDHLDSTLPVWDLCCDGGQIGCVAMDRHAEVTVVFVDKRPRILEALAALMARWPHYADRYRVVHADILRMDLPPASVNFIIAGVGTNLILGFLERLAGRRGDRVVCSTSQCPTRFETLLPQSGFVVDRRQEVTSRHGRQTIWALRPGDRPRHDRAEPGQG